MSRQRYHALKMAISAAAAFAAIWWWMRSRPFRVAVRGESMHPILDDGDFLIATAPRRVPVRRGALVVLAHPHSAGLEIVKRVLAIEGDGVEDLGGRVLGPGQIWVVGEDPAASTDSRSFGPVSPASIVGVVRLRYWPPSRAGPVL